MKWTNLVVAGSLVGAFSLGALLTPIGNSSARTGVNSPIKKMSVIQTANDTGTSKEESDAYNCPMTGVAIGSGGGMMGQYFGGSMASVIAETLGMTEDELQAARQEGKSLADIAAEKGVQEKDLLAAMVQSRKSDLEKLVKDGTITKEQMGQMLNNMESMMEAAIQQDAFGPMNGHGKGMGRGMGAGGYWNNGQTIQGL